MFRQAATKNHGVYHGGKLDNGIGSPDVFAHDHAVWRADEDIHSCAGGAPPVVPPGEPAPDASGVSADGPEILKEGAEQVLVNNRRLGRDGDFLLGPGAPNMIAALAGFQVLVGENGVGSDTDSFQEFFCQQFCALKKDWDKLTPDERLERWKDMTRALFDRLGMPAPQFDTVKADWHGGTFGGTNFMFEYNPGYFNGKWTPNDLADMTWHELRHGEQSFLGLRYALAREKRGISPPGQKEYIKMAQPHVREAAEKAGPLDDSTAEGRWAAMFADSDWTDAGQKQIGWAVENQNVYGHRYPTIPAGADARRRVDSDKPGVTPRSRRCNC